MVHKKLMAARIMLQNAPLKKSGHNKFAGYSYFELGDFIPTINQIFNEVGLCGVVSYDTEIASLTITDTDDGTSLVITSPMAEANLKGCHPIQNLGAVETYTRRYLWVTAMEIVEHDALDSSAPIKEEKIIITPTQGAMDNIPIEELRYLEELAMDLINSGHGMVCEVNQSLKTEGDLKHFIVEYSIPSNLDVRIGTSFCPFGQQDIELTVLEVDPAKHIVRLEGKSNFKVGEQLLLLEHTPDFLIEGKNRYIGLKGSPLNDLIISISNTSAKNGSI